MATPNDLLQHWGDPAGPVGSPYKVTLSHPTFPGIGYYWTMPMTIWRVGSNCVQTEVTQIAYGQSVTFDTFVGELWISAPSTDVVDQNGSVVYPAGKVVVEFVAGVERGSGSRQDQEMIAG